MDKDSEESRLVGSTTTQILSFIKKSPIVFHSNFKTIFFFVTGQGNGMRYMCKTSLLFRLKSKEIITYKIGVTGFTHFVCRSSDWSRY